jgi:hypothetical protein
MSDNITQQHPRVSQAQNELVGSFPSYFVSLLRSCPPVVLNIISFLPTQDLLVVESVNKGLNTLIIDHDEILFSNCLRNDFFEGNVLVDTVEKYHHTKNKNKKKTPTTTTTTIGPNVAVVTPYKRMYLAFRNRWKLHQQKTKSIKIPWRLPPKPLQSLPSNNTTDTDITDVLDSSPPQSSPSSSSSSPIDTTADNDDGCYSTIITDDVNALVFIVRMGNDGNAVGLMEWEPNQRKTCPGARGDRLVMNRDIWDDYDWYDNFDTPYLDDELLQMISQLNETDAVGSWLDHFERIQNKMGKLFCISLHVVDIQRFQVMSILEDCPATDLQGLATEKIEMMGFTPHDKFPILFGVPPRTSPYYKPVDEYEFDSNYDDRASGPYINSLVMDGTIRFCRDYEDLYVDGPSGIEFNFDMDSNVIVGYEICNLFRALMKENCIYGGVPVVLHLLSPSIAVTSRIDQPAWLQNERVLDTITSFLPFELQAEGLRLVCRQFKDSAMRQIETKLLDETKVIGFERSEPGWLKVQVRRGWSGDPFGDTKDSIIDGAFSLASCHCTRYMDCCCKDRYSNSTKQKAVEFKTSKGK